MTAPLQGDNVAGPGRKPFAVNEEVLNKIYTGASRGLSKEQVSVVLGWSRATFFDKIHKFPEILDAYDQGKEHGIDVVTNALFERAENGCFNSQKYYLSRRDKERWSEEKEEQKGNTSPVQIIINRDTGPEDTDLITED